MSKKKKSACSARCGGCHFASRCSREERPCTSYISARAVAFAVGEVLL
jgi:hypothetical protein